MTGSNRPIRIFIAAPMSVFASDAEYARHRDVVAGLCAGLEKAANVSVYFAGRAIHASAAFDDPAQAFLADFDALTSCDLFVLYYPEPVRSSVLVETGMAIGRGKPCLILTTRRDDLVFLLRNAENRSGHGNIPPILVRELGGGDVPPERMLAFVTEALRAFGLVSASA